MDKIVLFILDHLNGYEIYVLLFTNRKINKLLKNIVYKYNIVDMIEENPKMLYWLQKIKYDFRYNISFSSKKYFWLSCNGYPVLKNMNAILNHWKSTPPNYNILTCHDDIHNECLQIFLRDIQYDDFENFIKKCLVTSKHYYIKYEYINSFNYDKIKFINTSLYLFFDIEQLEKNMDWIGKILDEKKVFGDLFLLNEYEKIEWLIYKGYDINTFLEDNPEIILNVLFIEFEQKHNLDVKHIYEDYINNNMYGINNKFVINYVKNYKERNVKNLSSMCQSVIRFNMDLHDIEQDDITLAFIQNVCYNDKLYILEWLHKKEYKIPIDKKTIDILIIKSNVKILDWFHNNSYNILSLVDVGEILERKNDHITVAWLFKKNPNIFMGKRCVTNNYKIIELFLAHNLPISYQTCIRLAVRDGRIDTLMWLKNNHKLFYIDLPRVFDTSRQLCYFGDIYCNLWFDKYRMGKIKSLFMLTITR